MNRGAVTHRVRGVGRAFDSISFTVLSSRLAHILMYEKTSYLFKIISGILTCQTNDMIVRHAVMGEKHLWHNVTVSGFCPRCPLFESGRCAILLVYLKNHNFAIRAKE